MVLINQRIHNSSLGWLRVPMTSKLIYTISHYLSGSPKQTSLINKDFFYPTLWSYRINKSRARAWKKTPRNFNHLFHQRFSAPQSEFNYAPRRIRSVCRFFFSPPENLISVSKPWKKNCVLSKTGRMKNTPAMKSPSLTCLERCNEFFPPERKIYLEFSKKSRVFGGTEKLVAKQG